MEEGSQITEFGKVFIYLLGSLFLVLFTLGLGKFLSPKKPTAAKQSTYECGEIAQGSSWIQFNSRFYVIALVFLLFDVEMVFIFPWTTIFGSSELIAADSRWGWYTLIEMFIFIGILIIGLVYVWKKGDLEWVKPHPTLPTVQNAVLLSVYEKNNQEIYEVKPFGWTTATTTSTEMKVAPKPTFKPKFIKKNTNG